MKKIFKLTAYVTLLEIGVTPAFTETTFDKNKFDEAFLNELTKNIENSFKEFTILKIDFKKTCFSEKCLSVVIDEVLPSLLVGSLREMTTIKSNQTSLFN